MREDLKSKVNLQPDNLENSAWNLRLLRRELEKDTKNDDIIVSIETAIWAIKVLWGRQNLELLTPEEISHWMNCRCVV